ncbi:MAG TPA: isoprenylcysteine carboxyl methyltransferase family protein [Mycobacterium sp.]
MYNLLIVAVGIERLVELLVSRRNGRWAATRGGVEFGHSHYPALVAVHAALLAGCPIEVWAVHRAFIGWLGWPMLAVVAASQALRWWCVATLGRRWNTRVIVIPQAPLVRRGPYRLLKHPNYLAVTAEGLALPLVHTAWLTAIGFAVANALVLAVRLRVENAALGYT